MIKVVIPQIGQSIAEATIVKWFKKPGDRIEKGEILVEIGTDKINTEIPAPDSGIVEQLLFPEGETVPVQSEIAVISASGVRAAGDASSSAQNQRHSPLVRRLAQEHHVDLSKITGTGEAGRITKEDVQRVIDARPAAAEAEKGTSAPTGEVVPMSRMRKLIAEHMLSSKRATAELTTFFEIDMTAVAREREKARERYQIEYKLKLTYLPFIVVAVSKALRKFPVLNSSVEGESIHYKKECNIGIATALDQGLIVPVLRKADEQNVRCNCDSLDGVLQPYL
jgi:2-oxoglutarate dehydrogenase E2 component (dihydrolipoamide succinyltransferase)/2-oxoisovalerate dehydrogenase E2 component (dihydrolipoyl transacylase)